MKTSILTLATSFYIALAAAQQLEFVKPNPQPVIQEVYSGSLVSEDFDNDGDIDLIQSGIGQNLSGQGAKISLFINDGLGNFTLKSQNFSNYFTTEQITSGDVDNDGDQDVIVSAQNRTDLYLNDGNATFLLDNNSFFEPSKSGTLLGGDFDKDGDLDFIQFGQDLNNAPFAFLYRNNGSGVFARESDQDFIATTLAFAKTIDMDDDDDLDLIVSGKDTNDESFIRFYSNNGLGDFTLVTARTIPNLLATTISTGDLDGDGDEDFICSGEDATAGAKTGYFINDGNGQFTAVSNTAFPDLFASSSSVADLDNDGDLDVLLIGSMNGGIPNIFSIVFENLGGNSFVAADSLSGEYIPANTIADFNGDRKKDIIIQGFVDDTNIYWNTSQLSGTSNILDAQLNIFPNPTAGQIHLSWETGHFDQLDLYDMQGRSVAQHIITANNQIDLALGVQPGMYMIVMRGKEGVACHKVIVE